MFTKIKGNIGYSWFIDFKVWQLLIVFPLRNIYIIGTYIDRGLLIVNLKSKIEKNICDNKYNGLISAK